MATATAALVRLVTLVNPGLVPQLDDSMCQCFVPDFWYVQVMGRGAGGSST